MFRPIDKLRYIVNDVKGIFKKQTKQVIIEGKNCEIIGRIGTFHIVADITGKDINIGNKAILQVNPTLVNPQVVREYE